MSLCFLSLETSKVFNELILKELEKKGFDGLSSSLILVFPFLFEYEDISISNLAKKLGYSRQAMHKNLKKLENLRYLDFLNMDNKKEKKVKLTKKGLELISCANNFISSIQDELAKKIGNKKVQEYIQTQTQIIRFLEQKEEVFES